MSSKLRVFVAISLSEPTRQTLRRMQQALNIKGLDAKWTRPDQFHVTLKFLGEIDASATDLVVASVERVVSGRAPFSLTFQGIGAFPGWSKPRVIWAGVAEGRVPLIQLAHEIEEALTGEGFASWDRPFRPHLTLGRVRSIEPDVALSAILERLTNIAAGPERVERVVIYRSRLTAHGPIYSEIASLPFQIARGRERS